MTPKIGAIAAMTRQHVIGVKNQIPWHYSEDFKRFKRITLHSTLIMGRNTWMSIGNKPLPKRRNIVITSHDLSNVEHYSSIQTALKACAFDPVIWFIGGGQIYSAALPFCTHLDITWVPDVIDKKNAILFPDIDPNMWQLKACTELKPDSRLQICQYHRLKMNGH